MVLELMILLQRRMRQGKEWRLFAFVEGGEGLWQRRAQVEE